MGRHSLRGVTWASPEFEQIVKEAEELSSEFNTIVINDISELTDALYENDESLTGEQRAKLRDIVTDLKELI